MSKASTLRKACQELTKLRDTFEHNPERWGELNMLVTELDKLSNPVKIVPRKIVSEVGKFERAVKAKADYDNMSKADKSDFQAHKDYARQLNSLFNVILKYLN